VAGYEPPTAAALQVTGLVSLVTAPFGAHTSNMAAISAAICTGPDAHPDPKKRWLTGPFYALSYLIFAIFGASLVALLSCLRRSSLLSRASHSSGRLPMPCLWRSKSNMSGWQQLLPLLSRPPELPLRGSALPFGHWWLDFSS
jgi:hypothetical protein